MNLAIVSVRRPGGCDFIYQSLLSLLATGKFLGKIDLFVGNSTSDYLEFLAPSPRVTLHRMTDEEWGAIADWQLPRRQSYVCWKAVDYFARRREEVCLCEDDILYDTRFYPKLCEAIEEADSVAEQYVLSLYADREFADDPDRQRRRFLATFPPGLFYGAQAMYFPAATLGDFATHLRYWGVDRDGIPTDLLIRDYCDARPHVPLYYTVPSIVQHIGRVSVSGAGFHTAPTFGQPWPRA